jgi:hypothetical protein
MKSKQKHKANTNPVVGATAYGESRWWLADELALQNYVQRPSVFLFDSFSSAGFHEHGLAWPRPE